MGILDALVIEEQYKDQVLQWEQGCAEKHRCRMKYSRWKKSLRMTGKKSGTTKKEQDQRTGRFRYYLKITNHEVHLMFEDMIEGWFPEESTSYSKFIEAFLEDDLDYMNQYMKQVALQTFSTFDTGKQPSEYAEPERFYHGFVLGLIVELADQYRITSNRESGLERYDEELTLCDLNLTYLFMTGIFRCAPD